LWHWVPPGNGHLNDWALTRLKMAYKGLADCMQAAPAIALFTGLLLYWEWAALLS
jgi:hypothetical protein